MATPKTESNPNEIELTGYALPGNVTTRMAESGVFVGQQFNTGMGFGGIVDRMVYIGGGTVRVYLDGHRVLMFSTGGLAVEK